MNTTNQLRQHLKFTLVHYLRIFWNKRRLGSCGDHVHFDRNIRLLRYPGNIEIEDHVVIKEGAQICPCNPQARILIGMNTTVGYYTFIFASERIEIGRNCLIAPFVYLVDSDHSIARGQLINQQPNVREKILIGDDVWIGTGAKILKGVTVGDGAIIAAGAVVKDDVAPNQIVGGIPARVIGERQ